MRYTHMYIHTFMHLLMHFFIPMIYSYVYRLFECWYAKSTPVGPVIYVRSAGVSSAKLLPLNHCHENFIFSLHSGAVVQEWQIVSDRLLPVSYIITKNNTDTTRSGCMETGSNFNNYRQCNSILYLILFASQRTHVFRLLLSDSNVKYQYNQ